MNRALLVILMSAAVWAALLLALEQLDPELLPPCTDVSDLSAADTAGCSNQSQADIPLTSHKGPGTAADNTPSQNFPSHTSRTMNIDHRPSHSNAPDADHSIIVRSPGDSKISTVRQFPNEVEVPGGLPLDEHLWRNIPIEDTELWREIRPPHSESITKQNEDSLDQIWRDRGGASPEDEH